MLYTINALQVSNPYKLDGTFAQIAYNVSGSKVFPDEEGTIPIPSGDLTASQVVPLPDIYESGKGFTCTGLAYDESVDAFLVGDIGILLPNSGTIKSQIVVLSDDFQTVLKTIPLYNTFSGMGDIQGITIDTSDNSIWFCAPSVSKIYHTNMQGENLGSISVNRPTGIAYSASDDSFWVLTYGNQILHVAKNGTVLETYNSQFGEALDQCFLDDGRGYLYIVAGTNYTSRNNVYLFNTNTHSQTIACTVDSYSVEGIWLGNGQMIIVNDGYYHSATVPVNQANIYDLT